MEKIRFPRPLKDFAEKSGVNLWTLYKIEAGEQDAADIQCPRIHWATRGRIPAWVLRPDLWKEGQVPPNPFRAIVSGSASTEAA